MKQEKQVLVKKESRQEKSKEKKAAVITPRQPSKKQEKVLASVVKVEAEEEIPVKKRDAKANAKETQRKEVQLKKQAAQPVVKPRT